ncbi:MAG: WD40 repeat domain-containing protein, partial [Armatimonadetes bacterium]|nr:WD40 repeat domain-containing protein [Armatimonadota bacterium]
MRSTLTTAVLLCMSAGVALAQGYTHLTWYTDPIRQTVNMSGTIYDVAVSPSGGQIALATENGVSLHNLNSRGMVKDLVKFLPVGVVSHVVYSPDGKYILASQNKSILIFRRGTWDQAEVYLIGCHGISSLDTISQRTEVYALDTASSEFWSADFATAQRLEHFYPENPVNVGNGTKIAASPDAERIYCLSAKSATQSAIMGVSNGPGTPTELWHMPVVFAMAMCVGPDPEHLMLATSGYPGCLMVIRGSDGEVVDCYDVPVGSFPSAMVNSRDGRFVVITSRA